MNLALRYLQNQSISCTKKSPDRRLAMTSKSILGTRYRHSSCQTRVCIGMPIRWNAELYNSIPDFTTIPLHSLSWCIQQLPRPSKILQDHHSRPFPTQANRCSLTGLDPFLELTWRARHSPVLHSVLCSVCVCVSVCVFHIQTLCMATSNPAVMMKCVQYQPSTRFTAQIDLSIVLSVASRQLITSATRPTRNLPDQSILQAVPLQISMYQLCNPY